MKKLYRLVSSNVLEIYNLKGQLLFSKSYNSATNQLKIDVSNIPNGIYILKIISKEEIFNYKIIK